MRTQTVTTHANLAAAIGAWTALECAATMARPDLMLDEDGTPFYMNKAKWNATDFVRHIDGMLDDLVEYTAPDDHSAPCKLIVVAHENQNDAWVPNNWPDRDHEWQPCLVGHCRLEAA